MRCLQQQHEIMMTIMKTLKVHHHHKQQTTMTTTKKNNMKKKKVRDYLFYRLFFKTFCEHGYHNWHNILFDSSTVKNSLSICSSFSRWIALRKWTSLSRKLTLQSLHRINLGSTTSCEVWSSYRFRVWNDDESFDAFVVVFVVWQSCAIGYGSLS